jgi:2-keto-4-pentenoate hydratase/2-oxohepta-3-ene-1,7-dioic acid hydratase in catechol pathway
LACHRDISRIVARAAGRLALRGQAFYNSGLITLEIGRKLASASRKPASGPEAGVTRRGGRRRADASGSLLQGDPEMNAHRLLVAAASVGLLVVGSSALAQTPVKYVRFESAGRTAWGILENETSIRELQGSVFDNTAKPTGRTLKLSEVKLLAPAEPKKVVAAGLNYKSHIGQDSPAKYVGLFAKFPTSLTGHGSPIIYPADATTLHYEAEVCVVMGKRAQNITEAQAKGHIFGVAPCNDVSERGWQKSDLQWFRAKGADTFGPIGPAVVTNVDYNKLKLIGRHNGKVVQETTTDLLIFSIDNIISYTSRYVTLEPGDVVFTGTPGTTQAMKPGDTFEVEIPGVGVLSNKIVAARPMTSQN